MYWGNWTASVSFCEPKYAVLPHLAEFHNTWSNIGFVLVACLTWRQRKPALALLAVGLGSSLLHATGRRSAQLCDELAMLWWVLTMIQHLAPFAALGGRMPLLYGFNVGLSLAYLVSSRFECFAAVFALDVICLICVVTRVANTDAERACVGNAIAAFLFAFLFWTSDQFLCPVLPVSAWGHVAWHLGSALACWHSHQVLALVRARNRRYTKTQPNANIPKPLVL